MQICDQGAINLMAGIVKRTNQDWRNARRNLNKRPRSKNAAQHEVTIIECERFFRSAYFSRLTGLNGEKFIRRLRKQEATNENV